MENAYQWVKFYEALADKLLEFSDKRRELFELMKKVRSEQPLMEYLNFEREDWWGPRNYHMDPLSVIGIFNRKTTDANRINLAQVIAETFGVEVPAPTQFAGIPVLNPMRSFFMGPDDIWELFMEAIVSAQTDSFSDEFKTAFEKAVSVKGNGLASITMGLYWIRPNVFMPLDSNSRAFVNAYYGITTPSGNCTGEEYVAFLKTLKAKVAERSPDMTFPEVSYAAWMQKESKVVRDSIQAFSSNDEQTQCTAFKQWYINNGGSSNTANTISTAIGKARLKDGRAVFAVTTFDELDALIQNASLNGYFQSSRSDYANMEDVFNIDATTQRDNLKSGIKYYLDFLKSDCVTTSSTKPAAWIFQGNPKYYDVVGAVENLDTIMWSVNQYSKQIKKGDKAYIWLSGSDGGIIASGLILCDPEIRKPDLSDPYNRGGALKKEPYMAVDIQIERKLTLERVSRAVLLVDERTKHLEILTRPSATNFRVTKAEEEVIESIIRGTYKEATVIDNPKVEIVRKRRYWLYAPGEQARFWDEFYDAGIMGIGWDEVGDLSQYETKFSIKSIMKQMYGEDRSYINNGHALWQLSNEISVGDIVFAKRGKNIIVGRGIVESNYEFDKSRKEFKHIHKVNWTHKGEWEH
ncbi:MAG: EVE domain-containing protein, partial [Pseudomonadaceae bacterium]|nr:EVE domain-containing protein [Pseudomonadaceae bacterium]